MKKILYTPLLFLSLLFFSCKKDAPLTPQQNEMTEQGRSIVFPGDVVFGQCADWEIQNFLVFEDNITNNFRGVRLQFCPEHNLSIGNDLMSYKGSWDLVAEKGNPLTLTLLFNSERFYADWEIVSGTWDIERFSYDMIILKKQDGNISLVLKRNV